VLLAVAFGPATARAQQVRKLEPVLAELLRPATRDLIRGRGRIDPLSAPETQPMGGQLALERGSAIEEPILGVFVRVRGPGGVARIRELGGTVGAVVNDLVSARIPLSALSALAAAPDIVTVEAARALRLENDSGMHAIRVDELRSVIDGAWQGATGAGAIVGIYDTGVDVRHEDFIDPQGRTRVLGVWDQTKPGKPPQGFNLGWYCTPAEVQQAIDSNGTLGCPQRDEVGHGTHVAGTAVGDGSGGGIGVMQYHYAGVAPAAGLLVVNGGPGIFFENSIIDGLRWLEQEGRRLGRPVVANLSLGGQFGSHDGSRLYERMIDDLSRPGFIVVVAAGNNAFNNNTTPATSGRLIHARGLATGTATREFTIEVPTYTANVDKCSGNYINMSLWYEGADSLIVAVQRPSGVTTTSTRGGVATEDNAGGRVQIDNGSGGLADNGDVEATIFINGCGTSNVPEPGTWRIRITPGKPGSGLPYDMWIYANAGPPADARGGFDNRFIVGSPGNAQRAVTVGAFVSRLCWPSITSANVCYAQREELGDIARFSNAGPTRDGRLKPEIAAPGLGVMSTHSHDASLAQSRIGPTGVHAVREGTSMATPHVTGAIALLLAADPQLGPEEVKAILGASATRDAFTTRIYDSVTGARPQDWWGYGKLNARDAMLALDDDEPATLTVDADPVSPALAVLGNRGARVPLLQFNLSAQGFEAIDVTAMGFQVKGNDAGARLLLVRDGNNNGRVDGTDPIAGALALALTPAARLAIIRPDSMRVQPFITSPFFLAVELSGEAPNGATFEATIVPQEMHSRGVRSGAADRLSAPLTAVASGPAAVTVLEAEELLSLSANPVRTGSVVFNFAAAPATAAVYTITGRRVIDLCGDAGLRCGLSGGATATRWELQNGEGERVAPGVYLLIFQVNGRTFREKLMVLTRGGEAPEPR
jgi:subtilisin family serine protease